MKKVKKKFGCYQCKICGEKSNSFKEIDKIHKKLHNYEPNNRIIDILYYSIEGNIKK